MAAAKKPSPITAPQKKEAPKGKRGGARPGAGRPKKDEKKKPSKKATPKAAAPDAEGAVKLDAVELVAMLGNTYGLLWVGVSNMNGVDVTLSAKEAKLAGQVINNVARKYEANLDKWAPEIALIGVLGMQALPRMMIILEHKAQQAAMPVGPAGATPAPASEEKNEEPPPVQAVKMPVGE